MNKKGFTMIELLSVLALVAIISVSAVIVFDETSQNTNKKDLKNKYEEIQRSSILFLDMNDSWISDFNENGSIYLRLGELQSKNYITTSLRDPVEKTDIPSTYMVKIWIKDPDKDTKHVTSAIVCVNGTKEHCVANRKGEYNKIEFDSSGKCTGVLASYKDTAVVCE